MGKVKLREITLSLAQNYPALFSIYLELRRLLRDYLKQTKDSINHLVLEFFHYRTKEGIPIYIRAFRSIKLHPSLLSELANKSYDKFGFAESQKLLCESEKIQSNLRKLVVEKQIGEPVLFFDPGYVSAIGHIALLTTFSKLEKANMVNRKQKVVLYNQAANIEYLNSLSDFYTFIKLRNEELEGILRRNLLPIQRMGAVEVGDQILNDYLAQNLAEKEFRKLYGIERHLLDSALILESISRVNHPEILTAHPGNFVTFHIRSAKTSRDRSANNAQIRDYIPAVKFLQSIGMKVVFLGHQGMPRISDFLTDMNHIWDYAHDSRKDPLIDLYLLSNAAFVVNTASGPVFVSNDFGVPILYTNQVHIGMNFDLRGYVIPHLILSKKSGKLLSYSEMLNTSLAWNSNEELDDFVRVKNSKEDILLGVKCIVREIQENKINNWFSSREDQKFSQNGPSMTIEPDFYSRNRQIFTQ